MKNDANIAMLLSQLGPNKGLSKHWQKQKGSKQFTDNIQKNWIYSNDRHETNTRTDRLSVITVSGTAIFLYVN